MALKVKASLQFAKMANQDNHGMATLRAHQSAAQLIEDIRGIAPATPPEEALVWGGRRSLMSFLVPLHQCLAYWVPLFFSLQHPCGIMVDL